MEESETLEQKLFFAKERNKIVEDAFKKFINEHSNGECNINYRVFYRPVGDKRYIARDYTSEFVENGPIPENNTEIISLINEFSEKHNVSIDYFLKLNLMQKMNH
jgi:hypothetical protein